jgi:hypothetical protein
MLLQVVADAAPESKIAAKERKGEWSNGQWERVQPLFQVLLSDRTWSIPGHDFIRERTLLWLYSKISFNYHLASQNDSRCWRDIRALQASGRITGDRAQNAKKFLRDSMEKHTELLQIAKKTLDQALEGAVHQDELSMWQKKVDIVILYQNSRIDMIVKNIDEGRNS